MVAVFKQRWFYKVDWFNAILFTMVVCLIVPVASTLYYNPKEPFIGESEQFKQDYAVVIDLVTRLKEKCSVEKNDLACKETVAIVNVLERFVSESNDKQTINKVFMNKSTVKLGSIYNIGIGGNESADAIVVGIERIKSSGDQAVLALIDFGSPYHRQYVSSLENQESIERKVDFSKFDFSKGDFDATDSLRNFIERTEKETIETENNR
jgi:hypothetical protein